MNKCFLLCLIPFFCYSQNDFYLGFGSVSTVAKIKNENEIYGKRNLDFGVYYGNNVRFKHNFITVIEAFYLNQQVILNETRNTKFELHQNIGFGIKPGFYSGKHSIHLSAGVLGVYVFDQNNSGNQFDHFDESYYYGMDYNYDLSNKLSCNFGVILSEFYSRSHFGSAELEEFAVLQFTLHYKIF